jgi:multidrug resistance efflux pump
MVEAVYSSVVLAPLDVYKVNASISGYLERVRIEEGQLVNKGAILFTISSQPILLTEKNAALTYQNAQRALVQNESVLDELKIELQTARYKLQNDSMQAGRASVLFDKNAISKMERDNLILAYMASKNTVNSLKKRLIRTQNDLQNQASSRSAKVLRPGNIHACCCCLSAGARNATHGSVTCHLPALSGVAAEAGWALQLAG